MEYQRKAGATGGWICNKIAERIIKVSKTTK